MSKNRIGAWLATFVMTIALALGIASPAMAVTSSDTGSVALGNIEAGTHIDYYQVITVTWDYEGDQPQEPVYVWSTEGDKSVANWIKDNHSSYIDAATNAVTAEFEKADAKAFYDELSAAIKGGEVSLTAKTATAGEGATTIDGLALGTHLFIIGNSTNYVYQPVAQNVVPKWNEQSKKWEVENPTVEIDVKRSPVDIKKTVNDVKIVGAQYGDTVNYDLNVPVPQYPDKAFNKLFYISDTLSHGLTLDKGSIKVYGVKGNQETPLVEGADYQLTETNSKGETASFGINMNEPYYDKVKQYDAIHVDYNAVVNSEAEISATGNENEAKLEFNNDPYNNNGYKTDTDKTTVFTFGIDIAKQDKEDKTPLSGAQFNLSTKQDGSNPMQFVKESDGVYHLYDAKNDTNKTPSATVEVDANGKLDLKGLNEGTYYLIETKAPGGYIKPSGAVTITITAIKDAEGNITGSVVDQSENKIGYVPETVLNDKGFGLPKTGGAGTIAITAAGVCVMAGAAVVLLRSRKNN